MWICASLLLFPWSFPSSGCPCPYPAATTSTSLYLSLPLSLSPYQLVHHRPSLTQHSARMPHAKYAIVSTCSEKYSPNPDPKVASVAVKS